MCLELNWGQKKLWKNIKAVRKLVVIDKNKDKDKGKGRGVKGKNFLDRVFMIGR